MSIDNRRRSERKSGAMVKTILKTIYRDRELAFGEGSVPLDVENISEHGMGLIGDVETKKDDILILDVDIEGALYERILVRVVWVYTHPGYETHFGVEFVNISGKLFSHIRSIEVNVEAKI